MNWKQLLAAAQTAAKSAQEIAAKASRESRALTDEEQTEFDGLLATAREKKAAAETARRSADDLAELDQLAKSAGSGPDDDDEEDDENDRGSKSGGGLVIHDRREAADELDLGSAFVKSDAYKAYRKAFPDGHGKGTPVDLGRQKIADRGQFAKALTVGQAQVQPRRLPMVDQVDRDPLTLLDLISSGSTDGDFEYLQVIGVTRNARIVKDEILSGDPADDLKPLSEIQTQLADAKVYTYADGFEVTNKLLKNAPALASFMNAELRYSLNRAIAEKILGGSGTNGEPTGILNTTGVQAQTYVEAAPNSDGTVADETAMAFIKAARRAMGKVQRVGGAITAIGLSHEMEEAIDLLQDDNGRFFGQGPFGAGPGTLWGRPRVPIEQLAVGSSVLGDWRTVQLLDQGGLTVQVFNQHKDYAQRNLNYVRAEVDAAQVIWRPNRLCVVSPTTTPDP